MAESSTPQSSSALLSKPHQPLDFNFPKHSLFFIMVCFLIADHIQGNPMCSAYSKSIRVFLELSIIRNLILHIMITIVP